MSSPIRPYSPCSIGALTYVNDNKDFGVGHKDDLGHAPLTQHAENVPSLPLNRNYDSVRVHLMMQVITLRLVVASRYFALCEYKRAVTVLCHDNLPSFPG